MTDDISIGRKSDKYKLTRKKGIRFCQKKEGTKKNAPIWQEIKEQKSSMAVQFLQELFITNQ